MICQSGDFAHGEEKPFWPQDRKTPGPHDLFSPCYDLPMELPGPIVFFGTPDFAVPTLRALCANDMEPARVVTQPARPVGRGRRVVEPPVAQEARALGVPVRLVESVKTEVFHDEVRELEPWIGVVVAFGQIFPSSLLTLPRAGCVNLHASLLPKYRGAAPVQAAIANGEVVTGVTTMQMEAGLDSGPMLLQEELEIGEDETSPQLAARLSEVGAELMIRTLQGLVLGEVESLPQDDSLATFAPKLSRSDAVVDWSRSASELFDRWRAHEPWPGTEASLGGEPVKIKRCRRSAERARGAEPGGIISTSPSLDVACGKETVLTLESLQRRGRAAVDADSFVNGERLEPGERFDLS